MIGWFFGFKVHLIINEWGGLVKRTQANVYDRIPVLEMVKNLFGKWYADKGYISKDLTEHLLKSGIHLITGLKKIEKTSYVPWQTKFYYVNDRLLRPLMIR